MSRLACLVGGTGQIGRAVARRLVEGGLVDAVAYTPAHAEQLLSLSSDVGSLVMVSSASVYADEEGRSLDEATDPASFPALPVPVPETQATVAPGDATYSTRKVATEGVLLASAA